MTGQSSHGGVETRVGNTFLTHTSIVVRVIYEPFHRVVGITGFIGLTDILFRLLALDFVVDERTDVIKITFRHVFSSHVLENEDISRIHIRLIADGMQTSIPAFTVRSCTIASPLHQDRMLFRFVHRFIDGSIQLYTISHGNHHFLFRVMLFDPLSRVFSCIRDVLGLRWCKDENAQ